MIWEKGVKELIEAAKLLSQNYRNKIFFKLYGLADSETNSGIPASFLEDNKIENYLEWFGYARNMDSIFNESDIVVFPSYYREGMPKSLLEACASGKPIVTTNAIGCKECVDEGLNGYKVPIKSAQLLADALEKLINAPEDRKRMGIYSRQKAEREFDQQEVVKKHMEIYNELLR
jgi:glycosyltransferase involved in cell wall biosynthesis